MRTPTGSPTGRELFVTGCSSCHGIDGKGAKAPDGSPSGARHWWTRARPPPTTSCTPVGCPSATSNNVPVRKDPAYTDRRDRRPGRLRRHPRPRAARPRCVGAPAGDLAGRRRAVPSELRGLPQRHRCRRRAQLRTGRPRPGPGHAARGRHRHPLRSRADAEVRRVDASTGSRSTRSPATSSTSASPTTPGGCLSVASDPIPEGFMVWVFGMGGLLIATGFDRQAQHRPPTSQEGQPVSDDRPTGPGPTEDVQEIPRTEAEEVQHRDSEARYRRARLGERWTSVSFAISILGALGLGGRLLAGRPATARGRVPGHGAGRHRRRADHLGEGLHAPRTSWWNSATPWRPARTRSTSSGPSSSGARTSSSAGACW